MRFDPISILPGVMALVALGAPAAGPAAPPSAPIRPVGECLKIDQVLDWGVVDQRRLVVKGLGKRYYDVRLSDNCPDLLKRPYLSFREGLQQQPGPRHRRRSGIGADPVTHDGRICGDLGDAVVPRSALASNTDIPCRIGGIRRIDEAAYEGMFRDGKTPARSAVQAQRPPSAAGTRSVADSD